MCIDHHIILFDKRKKSATNTLLPQPRKRITITTNIERVSHLIIESQRTKYNLTLDMNIEPSILDTKRIPRKQKKKHQTCHHVWCFFYFDPFSFNSIFL